MARTMLFASGELRYEPATLKLHVGFGRGIELELVEREHLVYDTRWLPPRASKGEGRVLFHVYLEGDVAVGGAVVPTPFAVFEQAIHYWGGGDRRPAPLRAGGARFSKIELTLDERFVLLPRPEAPSVIALPPDVLRESRALAELLRGRSAGTEEKARAAAAWLAALSRAGWIEASIAASALEPASGVVARFWSALEPSLSTLDLGVSLRLLATRSGVTTRQVARNIEHLLAWTGHPVGFRVFLAEWRVRLAVMLLSAPAARLSDIAALVGYASVESMSAAFRDAGLAPPAEVQEAVSEPIGP